MKNRAMRTAEQMLAASLLVFCSSVPAAADGGPRGGGEHAGGGNYGGGGHFGGGHGGHGGGGYGDHGGYRGGYRGGYGFRGGEYRGGGYGGWGWGGVGLGLGLGLGLYYATLPYDYATFWGADGIPYYYANDNYYQWDGSANEYQTVSPPVDVQRQAANQSVNLMVYPNKGQSDAQQATDKTDCRTWASSQSGFNPQQAATPQDATATSANNRSDYLRAETACLEGRGYSVK